MGMFWGNSWYQVVHDNLEFCGVVMLSKYPSASGGVDSLGNETVEVILPQLPNESGFTFIAHKDERTAILASKLHVLDKSRMDLLSNLYVIDDSQCELDEYRLKLKMGLDDKQWLETKISNLKQTILDFKEKVKELRRLRKAKPTEFLESELVAIAKKMAQ